MSKIFNRAYLFAVLVAGFHLAQEFGLPISDRQNLAVVGFLAVLFGTNAAYHDPRVPLGRGQNGDRD